MEHKSFNAYPISIRNNLGQTVRVTITVSSSGRNQDEHILVTLGSQGATLRDYYGVCIDKDVKPNNEWENAGILIIEPHYQFRIKGKESEKQK